MKLPMVLISFYIFLASVFIPFPAHAQFLNMEVDARNTPWSSITRLALEGGFFPPAVRPVTEAELLSLLTKTLNQFENGNASSLHDVDEYARLLFLMEYYKQRKSIFSFHGCACKNNPLHLRIGGQVLGGYSELGNPIPFEGGLSFAPGYSVFFEPSVELAVGSFWSAFSFRLGGKAFNGGVGFDWPGGSTDPLTWPEWPVPTGKYQVRNARLKSGAWTGQVTRALVGVQKGSWALSAGWDQRRTGPGLTGNLNLDYQGRAFPALSARRTSPFRWNGFMTHLAPDQMLIRTGLLSERTIRWHDINAQHSKNDNPYFFQWLIGWDITSWFRTNFTHTVMATAREGTLWPDLLQINFPVIGTTWREADSGPITDRLFAVQFEFRWKDAPWPIFPSSAGRLFWDYGGTDFLPSGPDGLIPQISIPASIVGFELLSPRWDLGFEYAELQHTEVLWYSNGGYSEGYSQDQWLIGHPLGGSGEAVTGLVRIRPASFDLQAELQVKISNWGMPRRTPGTADQQTIGFSISRKPEKTSQKPALTNSPLLWKITAEWNSEKATSWVTATPALNDSQVERHWWSLIFKISI